MADYTLAENAFPLGSQAPDFNLKGVDGQMYSLASFEEAKLLVVMAVCNHCPYVQAYWDRIKDLVSEFSERGIAFVGINANDEVRYPGDSFEAMVATAAELELNFPYLRDEGQEIAKAYHMERTPQFFVFDESRQLRYTGGFDDSCRDVSLVKERPLVDALEDLLADREVNKPVAHFIGCSVKWVE